MEAVAGLDAVHDGAVARVRGHVPSATGDRAHTQAARWAGGCHIHTSDDRWLAPARVKLERTFSPWFSLIMRASCQEGSAVARPLTGSAACPGAARSTRVQSCCRPLRHECGGVVHGRDMVVTRQAQRGQFSMQFTTRDVSTRAFCFFVSTGRSPKRIPLHPAPAPRNVGQSRISAQQNCGRPYFSSVCHV